MTHRPRRITTTVLLAAAALIAPGMPGAYASASHHQLAHQLHKATRHSGASHLDYSIHDSSLGNFGRHSHRVSAPASNQKLFTAMTLMDLVGGNFHYRTPVAGTAKIVNHVLHGSLVVQGSGDPTLTRYSLLAMAKRLHHIGLRHVTGHLIVDDTRYSHKTRVAGWKYGFVPQECGPISAFSVDHNQWRRGKSYELNPTRDNARLFRHILQKKHVSVARKVQLRHAPPTVRNFLVHRSPSLAGITDVTLTQSLNFYAEMMLREAGAQRSGHGSPKTGVAAERALAHRLNLPLGVSHDGSGLSYADRESPATLVRWLVRLRSQPYFTTVYYALPLSCETGTLQHRLCGPNVRGQVRAKTGTLTHVSALSGYVNSSSGSVVTFSFLADGVRNFTKLYSHVDKAVGLLRREG
jgi:D-alanyl-D-alanine carboxypeptidase/D-alanyl-D-alanine-endopeptidase (penicillin-binding protein 4)